MFQLIADIIVYQVLKLTEGSAMANALNFFVYDSLKILVLILAVVAVIAFFRSFLDPKKFRDTMEKLPWGMGHAAAALFGAISPFCSCSSIPLFIGMIESRLPLGIAFSFLITSPLVNEVAFVIMGGLFGWKIAILYALSGIMLGIIGGMVMGALNMEKEVILEDIKGKKMEKEIPNTFKKRLIFSRNFSWWTFKKMYPYVLFGVAIGAIIHGYVPQEFFMNTVGKYPALSIPIATFVGIPVYAGCSTVAPIVFGMTTNGMPLGTSLALMMSIAGLSLPEAIILKRTMTLKLLLTFFGLVGIGIMGIGFLFNFF